MSTTYVDKTNYQEEYYKLKAKMRLLESKYELSHMYLTLRKESEYPLKYLFNELINGIKLLVFALPIRMMRKIKCGN